MAKKNRHDLSPLRPVSTVTVAYSTSLACGIGTVAYCVLLALFVEMNGGTVPPWTFRGTAIGCLLVLTSAIMFDLYAYEVERQRESEDQ